MNDVEDKLRRALRPVEPPAGFTERVMAALPPRAAPLAVRPVPHMPRAFSARHFMGGALAASLIVAVFLGQHAAEERHARVEQAGLEASRELMRALQVTQRKLDIAYQAVNHPRPADAEENRS
jgi:hypothetical protein